jgi:hypothetical protein
MGMTKHEFFEAINELAADFASADGDMNGLLSELEEADRDVAVHDPQLARHFQNIAAAIRDLSTYVRGRVGSQNG